MILYHGSNMRVTQIDLSKSRPAKDFGRAFYLSSEKEQAIEMARFKVETFGGEITLNEFALDEAEINDLKCLRFDEYNEAWARFILANRATEDKIHDYDIDFETFLKRIQYLEGITFQWAFCTERAIKTLKSI